MEDPASLVLHSIAERLVQYVVSLMLRVVDLESRHRVGQLTVSQLAFELDETMRIIEVLNEAVSVACQDRDCGVILDELSALSLKYRHVGPVKQACDAILIAGFEPFVRIITDFCVHGSTASDSFEEIFLKRIHSETVVEGLRSCPSIFKKFSTHIVQSGNHASVARSLGLRPHPIAVPETKQLIQEDYQAINFFNDCIAKSSSALYLAVNTRTPIEPAIRWFMQYFLITKSDWYTPIIEKSIHELEKPIKLFDRSYLNELLHQLPGSPSCELHPFQIEDTFGPGGCLRTLADIKKEELESVSLPAIKAFTLRPKVEFPLTLILTDSTVFKFQTVFRILNYCRIVSIKLSQLWLDFQSTRSIGDGYILISANMLLKRMTHFVENFLFHLNIDVIAACVRGFEFSEDIDEMRKSLEKLIEEILSRCCISPSCVRSVNKVLGTCSLFASHMSRLITVEDDLIRVTQEQQYVDLIGKFEDAFDGQMNSLLVQLKHFVGSDRARAQALVAKIDYNDYYSNKIGL